MLPRTEPSVSIFEETTTSAWAAKVGNTKGQGNGEGFQSDVHQTILLDSPVDAGFPDLGLR